MRAASLLVDARAISEEFERARQSRRTWMTKGQTARRSSKTEGRCIEGSPQRPLFIAWVMT